MHYENTMTFQSYKSRPTKACMLLHPLPLQNTTLSLWLSHQQAIACLEKRRLRRAARVDVPAWSETTSALLAACSMKAAKTPRNAQACLHKQSKTQVLCNALSTAESNTHWKNPRSFINQTGLHNLNT